MQETASSSILNLDRALLDLAEHVEVCPTGHTLNAWTIRHAFEGVQIFGETGSGKTTGSGKAIATALLKARFGGLVLTAKATDLDDWIGARDKDGEVLKGFDGKPVRPGYFHAAGRVPVKGVDYEILGEGSNHCFNFLDHEYRSGSGLVHNLVSLFLTAVESGGEQHRNEDAYWTDSLRQLLTNAIDLCIMATERVALADIQTIIQTAAQSREQARSKKWQDESICWQFLELASANLIKKHSEAVAQNDAAKVIELERRLNDFRQTVDYWILDFAGLADRTRSVVVSSFTAKSTGLTRSPLFQLFCLPTTLDIVLAARSGKIVFVNLPVKRYAELGRFAQVLVKTVWQRGIERNPTQNHPVLLWADEAQFFVTREDVPFQTTARSAGCATVYLTQSLSSYHAMMSGRSSEAASNSLLGNLSTKILHANGDPFTNKWAQSLFGDAKFAMESEGTNSDGRANWGSSQSMQPIVPASKFTELKKGGDANGYIVQAYIYHGGREWASEPNHKIHKLNAIRVAFRQTSKLLEA